MEARVEPDQAKRASNYEKAAKMVMDDAAGVFVYNTKWFGPYNKNIKGVASRQSATLRKCVGSISTRPSDNINGCDPYWVASSNSLADGGLLKSSFLTG